MINGFGGRTESVRGTGVACHCWRDGNGGAELSGRIGRTDAARGLRSSWLGCAHSHHWRIEGAKGALPPPPNWLRCSKLEVADHQSRDHKPKRCSKLKLFLEFHTIPFICLINIDKYYKICTFFKKSCINLQNFSENVINDLDGVCF